MTPREGMCHEDGQPHRCGRCDRDIIEAHPAATAREEAWKALLAYAECDDAYCAVVKVPWRETLARHGWSEAEHTPVEFLTDLRTRALALARSAGGT